MHLLAAAIVLGALALARWAPELYTAQMQEDRAVEWWSVGLFGAAGIVRLWTAVRRRRVFDGLVALFCIFVAGEEMSWGQRLIGYTPPAVFLEHNVQQEATIHNFADLFGSPKYVLMMALGGYGILLPLVALVPVLQRLLDRVGATAPSLALMPWFIAAVTLLWSYPVRFTGEWVELLAGLLFVAAAPLAGTPLWASLGATLAAAFVMTAISAGSGGSAVNIACARREAEAILDDVTSGSAALPRLDRMGSIHKRVYTAGTDGYLAWDRLSGFHRSHCPGRGDGDDARRAYGIDPWGTAYWIRVEREDDAGERRVVVYSFGPNRRRDGPAGSASGDDVTVIGTLRPAPVAP